MVQIWHQAHEPIDPTCCVVKVVKPCEKSLLWDCWYQSSLDIRACLNFAAEHVPPFMATIYHLLLSQSKSTQTGLINMTLSSVEFNTIPLGCVKTGDLQQECTRGICRTVWCNHINRDQNIKSSEAVLRAQLGPAQYQYSVPNNMHSEYMSWYNPETVYGSTLDHKTNVQLSFIGLDKSPGFLVLRWTLLIA